MDSVYSRPRSAFTLIELMISIALIVVLMLGVNQVFKMSGDAISTGQTASGMTRDSQAAFDALKQDARNWAKDSPIFYIRDEVVLDSNGFPVRDAAGNTIRHDYMGFCSRGTYRRQTGDPGSMVSPLTSNEAFIWFGYCGDLNVGGKMYPNSRHAVGRFALLLKDEGVFASGAYPDIHIFRDRIVRPLSPLRWNSTPRNGGPPVVQNSRYDVAGTTLQIFRDDLLSVMTSSLPRSGMKSSWWPELAYAFQAAPNFPGPVSDRAAYAAPMLMENVSQVIIEFTGDFVTQDNDPSSKTYGAVLSGQPDGVPDFALVQMIDPRNPNQRALVRQARWYGLDRDPAGNGVLSVLPVQKTGAAWYYADSKTNASAHTIAPFEREYVIVPKDPTTGKDVPVRYTCLWANPFPGRAASSPRFGHPEDIVNDGMPTQVRVLVKLDDPSGRLQEGPWYEFILGPQ